MRTQYTLELYLVNVVALTAAPFGPCYRNEHHLQEIAAVRLYVTITTTTFTFIIKYKVHKAKIGEQKVTGHHLSLTSRNPNHHGHINPYTETFV